MHVRVVAVSAAMGWVALAGVAHQPTPAAPSATSAPAPTEPTAQERASFGGEQCFTRASRASTLGFTFPVEIAEVLVRGGQRVKAGDPLVRARDEDFVAQRDLQKLVADSDLEVQRAKATLDQAVVELAAQEQLLEKNRGASRIEVDRARANVAIRRAEHELALLERRQNQVQLRSREEQLARYTIRAPFDGFVDSVSVDQGEVKRETDGILRLVNVDPLWMDVPAPTSQTLTLGLRVGSPAWVLLDVPGGPRVRVGRVIEVAAEADPGSATRRVRVEMPNPEELPGGVTAWVRFVEPTGEWRDRVAPAAGETKGARR